MKRTLLVFRVQFCRAITANELTQDKNASKVYSELLNQQPSSILLLNTIISL
jgi:hypothetical protein